MPAENLQAVTIWSIVDGRIVGITGTGAATGGVYGGGGLFGISLINRYGICCCC